MPQYILNREDCVQLSPVDGLTILAAEADRTTMTIMEFEPNVVLQEHSHPHEQVGYMIEGEAEFIVDGQSYQVQAGQMWRFPGNVPHQVKVGNGPMRVFEVFCPVREDFRGKD